MQIKEKVKKIIDKYSIILNLKLGQHLLVDDEVLKEMAQSTRLNHNIIEIGAGVGQLTELLVGKAKTVWAFEIDKQFYPPLKALGDKNRNLNLIYEDFLGYDLSEIFEYVKRNIYIVGSLPYHITEPFFQKIHLLPVKQITLLVGIRLLNEIQANTDSPDFGKLGLLINTFYSTEVIKIIPKESFEPEPSTQSAIIKLTPRKKKEYSQNEQLLIQKDLFMSSDRGTKIKNVIKESLIFYGQMKNVKLTQNEARSTIKKWGIKEEILESNINNLSNDQLGELLTKLNGH